MLRILASILFALTAFGVYGYPFAQSFLAASLIFYAFILSKSPLAWLWLIPLILPVLNLAPWSGRFFLEEFDFYMGVSLGMALWQGAYAFRPLPILFLAGCFSISLVLGLFPLSPIDANAFSRYYSHYNALRVGRGELWALLMLPASMHAFKTDRQKARDYLGLGMMLGMVFTGLIVLWERGVLTDLIEGRNRFERLDHLLNFSSDYRITSVFSEMHIGGEAIDAYLVLAMPFSLWLLFESRPIWGVVSLCAVLYSALVTFSRSTYLAIAVSLILFASYSACSLSDFHGKRRLNFVPILILVLGLNGLGFIQGGFMVLASGLMLWAAVSWFKRFELIGLIFLLAFAGMVKGLVGSKWVVHGFFESIAWAIALCICLTLIGIQTSRSFKSQGLGVVLMVSVLVMGLFIPALAGYRMTHRFAGYQDDLTGRFLHWRHAIELMDDDWATPLFGMGLGRFPLSYALSQPESEVGGRAVFQKDGLNHYLTLSGGKDLRMIQRLSLKAHQNYFLLFKARTDADEALFKIRFCRRNIIYPTEWNASCLSLDKFLKKGEWQAFAEPFNLHELGDGVLWGRQPLSIEISNRRDYAMDYKPPALIDLDEFEVLDEKGKNLLLNGDFESGSDFWFPSYDFNYWPWHIENIWVGLYFEQGILGVFCFGGLVFYALYRSYRLARLGDRFALCLHTAIVGFLIVGLFGTLLDVPRISFLFFWLVFSWLADRQAGLEN